MTLLKTDSFEHGDTSRPYTSTATNFNLGSLARTGSRGFSSNFSQPSNMAYRVAAADEHATFIAGMALRFGSASTSYSPIISFAGDGGTVGNVYCGIQQLGSGQGRFIAIRGTYNTGVTLATSPVVIDTSRGVYHYIEMKAVLSDTVGSVVIRLDEVVVLSIGGVDTRESTAAVFDTATFYSPLLANTYGAYADDVYLCNGAGAVNNDFLGAVHIEYLPPTSTGNSSQGVGSDGDSVNNWALVDDAADPSDYVAFNGTGDKDTYVTADSAFSPARSVKGVTVYSYAEKTDAGTRTLDGVARLAGSEVSATMKNASLAAGASPSTDLTNGQYRAMDCVLETKPGGGAWTVGDVNASEFGVKAS